MPLRDELVNGIEKFKAKAGAAVSWTSTPARSSPWPPCLTTIRTIRPTRSSPTISTASPSASMKWARPSRRSRSPWRSIPARLISTRASTRATPLRYGPVHIHDFHAQHRVLTVPEVFTYSSNIGAARFALMVGVEGHKAFLRKMGQLDRMRTELPESADPLVPKNWGELNTMTIAFGQGLTVSPLQAMMAVGALVNGGYPDHADLPETHAADVEEGRPRAFVKPETTKRCAISCGSTPRSAPRKRPISRAISSAARPAPPTRSCMAIIPITSCSRPSWL